MLLRKNEILNGKYEIKSYAKVGNFGKVYEARNIETNETVAVKQIMKKLFQQDPKLTELFEQELNILKKMKSENIIGYRDDFERELDTFIVIEYCNGGTLEEKFQKNQRVYTEKEVLSYLLQILNGLRFLHSNGILHRDIKLDNIMIHQVGGKEILKIIDFGLSRDISQSGSAQTFLGNIGAIAPEIIQQKKGYGIAVDVFSTGVMLYQMLYSDLPFQVPNEDVYLREIQSGRVDFDKNGIKISNNLKDLIKKMLIFDPDQRIKWTELYEHPSILEAIEQVKKVSIVEYNELQGTIKYNIEVYGGIQKKENEEHQKKEKEEKQRKEQEEKQRKEQNIVQNLNQNERLQSMFSNMMGNQDSFAQSFMNKSPESSQFNQRGNKAAETFKAFMNKYTFPIVNVKLMNDLPETLRNPYLIFIQIKQGLVLALKLQNSFSRDGEQNFLNVNSFETFKNTNEYQELVEQVKTDVELLKRLYNASQRDVQQIINSPQNKFIPLFKQNLLTEIENNLDLTDNFKANYKQILRNHTYLIAEHMKVCFAENKKFDEKTYFISFIYAFDIYESYSNQEAREQFNPITRYKQLFNESKDNLLRIFKEVLEKIK